MVVSERYEATNLNFEFTVEVELTPLSDQSPMGKTQVDCKMNAPTRFLGTQR